MLIFSLSLSLSSPDSNQVSERHFACPEDEPEPSSPRQHGDGAISSLSLSLSRPNWARDFERYLLSESNPRLSQSRIISRTETSHAATSPSYLPTRSSLRHLSLSLSLSKLFEEEGGGQSGQRVITCTMRCRVTRTMAGTIIPPAPDRPIGRPPAPPRRRPRPRACTERPSQGPTRVAI